MGTLAGTAPYARGQRPGAGAARLRELIAEPNVTVMPGVYDMYSARLSEHEGFDVVFLSGQGLSGSLIGRPDYGFLTATEVLTTAGRMAGSVDVPVVVDFDTGYGGPMNVYHTIEQVIH